MRNPDTAWWETDRKNNATATATKTADANQKQIITGVYAAYSDLFAGTLVIKENSVAKLTLDVQGKLELNDIVMEFTAGLAVSAELSASGTAGVYGSVFLHGDTN
jgi:hypothetical protein